MFHHLFRPWLVFRFMTSGKKWLNLPSTLSLVGMTLGVACLVVAMGVISGFEVTLQHAVQDVFGHVLVVRRSERVQPVENALNRVKDIAPEVQAYTPFVQLEGVLASSGKITGVVIQGVDPKTVEQVLQVRKRTIRGKFEFGSPDGTPLALVGKGIEKKFGLKIGDRFQVVLPTPSKTNSTEFSPKVQAYILGGVLDLGKNEYDERYILTDLQTAQKFGDLGENFSGVRLKLHHPDQAAEVNARLSRELGAAYWIMDWMEVNKNLFGAIRLERGVIFFVLLIMVIAASFNISSNLFVSVMQRYADLSIMKAMGFGPRDVMMIFSLQGLFYGLIGTVMGIILGLILSGGFMIIQKFMIVMPADVYKLDHVGVQIRATDLSAILFFTFLICLISTLAPALRGARLKPVEGLRYE